MLPNSTNNLGLIIVEICSQNSINTVALDQFESDHLHITVLQMECLNNCKLCRLRPHALVNGKVVTAQTAVQCIDRIKEFSLKEMNEFV